MTGTGHRLDAFSRTCIDCGFGRESGSTDRRFACPGPQEGAAAIGHLIARRMLARLPHWDGTRA